VQDFVDVVNISGTPEAGLILGYGPPAKDCGIIRAHLGERSVQPILLDPLGHCVGKGFVIRHRLHLFS
jgi:hypothetical protein